MSGDTLKEATLKGMRWLALRSVVSECIAIASTVALARLLSPAEFGHGAVAMLFVLLAVILTFESFGSALVQRAEVDEGHREVAVLLNLVAGTVLGTLVFISAPLLWRPIFGEQTAKLIAISSPAFLIAAAGAVSRAMLWRQLDFRRVTQIDLATNFATNACSVAFAVVGLGAESLVLGAMAGLAVGSVLMMISCPEPLPRWHLRQAREIMSYGTFAAMTGLVYQVFANIDYWIVAARLSAYTAGIYYRAFNLGVVYQSKISNVMMQIAFPVYSRTESRDQMRRLHERATRIHGVVIFPCLALLFVLAPVVIPFVFGKVWEPAVQPTEILAIAGMFVAILVGYGQVMQALGKPGTLLIFNFAVLVVYATAVAIASSGGLIDVAIAVVTVQFLVLLGAYHFLLKPSIGLSMKNLLPEIGPAVFGCLVLVLVCDPLRMLLQSRVPAPVTIIVVGPLGLIIYAVVLRLLFRKTWLELWDVVNRVAPGLSRPRRRRSSVASQGIQATVGSTRAGGKGAASQHPMTPEDLLAVVRGREDVRARDLIALEAHVREPERNHWRRGKYGPSLAREARPDG